MSTATNKHKVVLDRRDTELQAEAVGMPLAIVEPALVTYRSVGIGIFGCVMRFSGMPLEKIALFMNSTQVSGPNPLKQAFRLTFADGALAPFRVVGPASMVAWFLQYSVMGFCFQFCDHSLSKMLGVKPVYYGHELMTPPPEKSPETDNAAYFFKSSFARLLSPALAATLEAKVSNRAEVQRFYGAERMAKVEAQLGFNAMRRAAGPAFLPNVMRNVIMCQTTFLLTPITYKLYFPQEQKSKTSLFWYGLSMNIFVGNVFAITQQALWGRTLDYAAQHGKISYRNIIREGLQKDGISAFWTGPKWFSRVLMNAPAQGVLPWFYNEILPLGENAVLTVIKHVVYEPLLKEYHEVKKSEPMRRLTRRPPPSAEPLAKSPSTSR
jgi:hypothetical protein